MMIQDLIEYVSFRGERLTLVWQGEEPYVALRPICERLGLNWKGQHERLVNPENGFSCVAIHTTGADRKQYEMLCLHAVEVPLWLAAISPARVKPELREALIAYRKECALVLFQHVRGRLMGERDAAEAALARLRAEVLSRKPLWVRVRELTNEGYGFETIWRAARAPRWRVAEAIDDLMRLGVLSRKPAETPDAMTPRRGHEPAGDQLALFPAEAGRE
jgi:hypothetical protein